MSAMWKKLKEKRIWGRIYLERLGEPLLYNFVSIFVFFFGSYQKKIEYDLVPRQPYAFGLATTFKAMKNHPNKKVVIIEFGVAQGAGLFNLAEIAQQLSNEHSIDYRVVGFDTGQGMPPPIDYRDHPEKYQAGDFPPGNLDQSNLPQKTEIIYGEINQTLEDFIQSVDDNEIVGFISIDVDYYSSTNQCLQVFNIDRDKLLPSTVLYFDDVNNVDHNPYMGELLSIEEYNRQQEDVKICKMNQLSNWRIFKNALWLDQMYFAHVLSHDFRDPANWQTKNKQVLTNPYI